VEFATETKALFERLENKEVIFVISNLLREELLGAPERVRKLLDSYSTDHFETVVLTDEAKELANNYVAENVVGQTSLDDCRHIALATINKVDVLVSWNFKHIVNLTRINGYNGVNLKNGYQTLEIRTPKELLNYGKGF